MTTISLTCSNLTCPQRDLIVDSMKLFRCGQCQLMLYCSRDCQRLHWKSSHKKKCLDYKSRTVMANTKDDVEKKMNDMPTAVLVKAYTDVSDDENNQVCVVYDADENKIELRRRENVGTAWERMTHGIEDHIADMHPCKRFIAYVKKVGDKTIGSANICCICSNIGKTCGMPRSDIIQWLLKYMESTEPML